MTYKGKVKVLFEPVDDKIFFIAEHATILDEIGTMEAAVESGERIAELF
jgi:monoamine oxidase